MMERAGKALKISLSKLYLYRFRIIAGLIALVLALCALHFYTNNNIASSNMSLNYSEASAGLNPNSTRFNISELVSQRVMSQVLKAAGIENDMTWSDLAKCVSTRSLDKGSSSTGYISTTYQITYDQSKLDEVPKHMPGADDMVKLICNSYKSYFLDNYGDNKSILNYTSLVGTNEEPYISLNSLEVKLEQIYRYINMRIKENKSFKDDATGSSFISLMKDIENLKNYELDSIYSFILETGVSKDRNTLVSLETYKNKIETLSYDKYMAFYDADNNGIKLYDKAMSAIVMIPSVDSSKEYYMSRTKTANDEMAKNADSELQKAIEYSKSIANTNYLIAQVRKGSTGQSKNLTTAVKMIVDLKNSIDRISEELKVLDVSYIKYKTQNYLVFSYTDRSFMQKISFKQTAVEAAAALVVFFLILFFSAMNKLGKKKKKNAKI